MSAVPGYGEIDPTELRSGRIEGDAAAVSAKATSSLLGFLRARHVVALLAKSGEQLLREVRPGEVGAGPWDLDQVHVEILQAFAIAAGVGRQVPAGPKSMVRMWEPARRNLAAYLNATEPGEDADDPAHLARSVRLRTVYYRSVFNSDDAANVLPALFRRMDDAAEKHRVSAHRTS